MSSAVGTSHVDTTILYTYTRQLKKTRCFYISKEHCRFREGKKQTPKTILCIFHLGSGEQTFQFYGSDRETLGRRHPNQSRTATRFQLGPKTSAWGWGGWGGVKRHPAMVFFPQQQPDS